MRVAVRNQSRGGRDVKEREGSRAVSSRPPCAPTAFLSRIFTSAGRGSDREVGWGWCARAGNTSYSCRLESLHGEVFHQDPNRDRRWDRDRIVQAVAARFKCEPGLRMEGKRQTRSCHRVNRQPPDSIFGSPDSSRSLSLASCLPLTPHYPKNGSPHVQRPKSRCRSVRRCQFQSMDVDFRGG